MEALMNTLKHQTSGFKALYMEKTKQWAAEELERNIARRKAYQAINHKRKDKAYYAEQKWYWKSPLWFFTEEYIDKCLRTAELHYENSIFKLACRIQDKGLNLDSLSVSSVHMGVNLDLTITDGSQTVTAHTILAWGEIYRPHYRYLIR